jgi:hypothetical protein
LQRTKLQLSFRAFEFNDYESPLMVEVFKTNVKNYNDSEKIVETLKKKFPFLKINFDLDDCDKILRVEGKNISIEGIIREMNLKKFKCEPL